MEIRVDCFPSQPYSTDVNSPTGHASPLGQISQQLFDPQLAAFDLLRRVICGRSPFGSLPSERGSIPDDFKDEIEFGGQVFRISVYLDMVKRKFGLAVSERIRTHLLLLSGFDSNLESRLVRFFEAIRATDAEYTAGRFSDLFDDPLLRYYAALAILFLIASGCPEERQRALAGSVAEYLLTAHTGAQDVFDPELASWGEVSNSFQWSTEPGPFERQLQRHQNNPLFPARVRVVSAQQVTDARLADLKRMSDFMSTYRPVEQEVLTLPGKILSGRDASDLLKKAIDLLPSCMVLGNYLAKELEFLTKVSESVQRGLIAKTKDAELQNTCEDYMALTRCQGYLLTISAALPSGEGTEDYSVRSILSEDLDTIRNYANLCGSTNVLGDEPLGLAQRVMSEAIQAGLDPDLGQRKLAAFRSGLGIATSKPSSGIWAGFKRFIRRT